MGEPAGLYLLVNGNARSWIFRYMIDGKRRDLGLGSFGTAEGAVSLEEARKRAGKCREDVRAGIDPIEAKREKRDVARLAGARVKPFSDCLDGYLKAHEEGWRNPKHRAQWRTSVETYAKDFLSVNVAAISTEHVLMAIEPIWLTKTETASRVRGRIESVLDWAKTKGYRTGENPARWKGHLDNLLARPGKITKATHFAALPYVEVGAFMARLRTQAGIAAAAVEFTILTAARSGEVREAPWTEIDFDSKLWVVPALRMKAEADHTVPLSDAAIAVLKKMEATRVGDFIFPGAKEGKPLSDMSLTAVLRRMKVDATVHGFRSTFMDWASETTSHLPHVVDMALAHTIPDKVRAAYARGFLLAKRTKLMSEWARYCAKPLEKATVISMDGARRGTGA